MDTIESRMKLIGWISAAFLLILGAKLWLVAVFGTTLPWWDQWACHTVTFLQYFQAPIPLPPDQAALVEPTLSLKAFFAPHCEHRLVITRLSALALLILNSQWDARLEMLLNALLHTLTGLALVIMFWQLAGRRYLPLFCLVIILAFALPFSWEATLYSACISHYALLAFALAALWLLIMYRPGSWPWLAGLACALLDLLTMGSGLLAAAAVLGVAALRWSKASARQSTETHRAVWMICASLVVLALGAWLTVSVPGHAAIRSQSLTGLLAAMAQRCAWPYSGQAWLAPIAWLPFIALAIRYLATRGPRPVAEEFALALGLWILLQIAAMAFGRAGVGIASRHTVILTMAFPLNVLCAVLFLSPGDFSVSRRRIIIALFGLWGILFIPGLLLLSRQALRVEAPLQKYYYTQSEKNVRAFLASDNIADLQNQPLYEIPYPDVKNLAALLRHPDIRRILPAAVNPAAGKSRLGAGAEWIVARGQSIFWAGLVLILALGISNFTQSSFSRANRT